MFPVTCTGISGISASRSQIDTTSLTDNARTYIAGLAEPGAATFELYFDPQNTDHKDLHDIYKNGTSVKWCVGFADGTAAPTVTTGNFVLPTTRTFISFEGYVQDISFDFSINSAVKASCSIQVSGFPNVTLKAA